MKKTTQECLVSDIVNWFSAAKPSPTKDDLRVQLGCHLEEVAEMLQAIECSDKRLLDDAWTAIGLLADNLKSGEVSITGYNAVDLLDSTRDQCVTGVGIDYMAGFDSVGAQREVNCSNWSKFVGGVPQFDDNGKIAKPATYSKPSLEGFIGSHVKNS